MRNRRMRLLRHRITLQSMVQDNSSLSRMILRHWQQHRPQMVEELSSRNQLDQTLDETATRTADLLYELVSVKKMQYHAAWEIAMQEWVCPSTGDRLPSLPD